ncbi:uncharacterized protein LOC135137870 [Zophobas morio]|uniref:uncharacterized protein LOC135137870 n=1 Tax=Zophobas morio TaxID=2755281 RepID=UPI003082D041
MFKAYFESNETAFREYLHCITQWSMKEGNKFKLNKMSMKHLITLCVFSPFIKPLSFVAGGRPVNARTKIFREAISKFDLTVINKNNFEKIESLWSNAVEDTDDTEETIKINNKHQLTENVIEKKESLYGKDATELSKLMWLRGKSPLVVEGCPQVYKAIKICQPQNLIVLDNQETFTDNLRRNCTDLYHDSTGGQKKPYQFQKLSDLKEHVQLYEEILTNFTYSLQGQKPKKLKFLLKICEDNITTDDFVEMMEAPLQIGKYKDVLPPSHIKRKLTKFLIDVKFLKNIGENTIVLVDCATDVSSFQIILPNLVISEVNDADVIQSTIHEQKIYICGNDVSHKKFFSLCQKNSEIVFHHFRYLDKHHLEWIETGNCNSKQEYIKELKRFRLHNEVTEYTVGERQHFNHSRQNINIICADPGMGKSTLMKSLKKSSSSSKWIILIYARNHALHFRKHGSDLENFSKYVLEDISKECTNPFHQRVFETMLEQNQIQLIWDGLDETTDATQNSILTLVQTFSKKGVKQWITSRKNLKDTLEHKLNVFARNIKQFNDNEQREYIKSRLQISENEVNETFNKIKKNLMYFPNYEILGIPLQIYMLTELFLSDIDKYLTLLDGIFTVIDLYEHFVEQKFHVLYRDKQEITLRNEQNNQYFENEKNARMKHYKILAASYYTFHSLKNKIKNKFFGYGQTTKNFLKKNKNQGDDVGFIAGVISRYDVEFVHNSYGEYFAALYLFEHKSSKARDRKFISNSRHRNIRFFLDLMLARNSKCLVGVIYKNLTILGEFTDAYLLEKDIIGRDILEVACAWNKNYPLVQNNILLKGNSFNKEWIITNDKEVFATLNYRDVAPKFCKFSASGDICFKKLMILLPFLIPLYDGNQFVEEYLVAVLYYAIRFDFPVIFECIENSILLKNTYNNISLRSVLALALFNRSERILKKLLSDNQNHSEWDCVEELLILDSEIDEILTFALHLPEFRIDVPNSRGQSLVHYACEKKLTKTLGSLILRQANLNDKDRKGKRLIHIAREKGHLDGLKLIAQTDVSDTNGQLPLHYACEHGDLDVVKLLLKNGAKVDAPDGDGRRPIHYACELGSLNLVKILGKKGAKMDVPDGGGQLPMHYACKNCFEGFDIIFFMRKRGAKMDIPDGDGRLPIHNARLNPNFGGKTITFLLKIMEDKIVPET